MSSQTNKSLTEGIDCLRHISIHDNPLGCRETARMLNINPMRANRLMMTLEETGLLQKNNKKKYSPGPGIHVLAAQSLYGSGLLRSFLKFFEKKSIPKHWLIALGVLWKDKVSYLYHGHAGKSIAEGIGRVGLFDAVSSSIGLILLSRYDQNVLIDTLGSNIYQENKKKIYQLKNKSFCKISTPEKTLNLATPIQSFSGTAFAITDIRPSEEKKAKEFMTNITKEISNE